MPLLLPPFMLFDLDDTIIENERNAIAAWHVVSAQAKAARPELDHALLFERFVFHRVDFWRHPANANLITSDPSKPWADLITVALGDVGVEDPGQELSTHLARFFFESWFSALRPFDGAIESLSRIKESGVGMALVTNGPSINQRAKIERFDLERHFDVIVIEGELGKGKPHHAPFNEALSALGAMPDEAWMVGNDLENDIAPAIALGLRSIWVDWAQKGLPTGAEVTPHRTIARIADLVDARGEG